MKSLGNMMYRSYYINSGALKGKHGGVYRRLETKVLDKKDSTRQEKTEYDRALPYVII